MSQSQRSEIGVGLLSLALLLGGCGGSSTPATTTTTTPPAAAEIVQDCPMNSTTCTTIAIAGESNASGGFAGMIDPSMRKDPNAGNLYLAYSWPHTYSDGTHAVDLHLTHSTDGGATWSLDGTLFKSTALNNPGGGNYAASNYTSHEVVDLLPISQSGSTLWVQAHMGYLTAAGNSTLYNELDQTSYISVSATTLTAASAPANLLALGTAKEARLGDKTSDPTLGITQNLSTLNTSLNNCTNWNQPTLWYANSTLYLALQCFETPVVDSSEYAFFLFTTTPSGSDATQWVWAYSGEFGTPAQAVQLGTTEGTPYQFFTEIEFVASKSGALLAIMTPGVYTATGNQPAIQYGCRTIPMTLGSSPALQTDTSGNLVVTSKVTESDLYTGTNEGPAACTYEPASSTGMVLVRKLEPDPTAGHGFVGSLLATGVKP